MVFRNLTEKMRKSLAEKNRQNTMVMPQFDYWQLQYNEKIVKLKGLQYAEMSTNFDALFVLTDFPSKLCMPHQAKVTVEVKEKNHENDNP